MNWADNTAAPAQDYSWGAAVKSAAEGLGGLLGTAGQIYFQYENQKFAKDMAKQSFDAQLKYLNSGQSYAPQSEISDFSSSFSKIPMPIILGGAALLFLTMRG